MKEGGKECIKQEKKKEGIYNTVRFEPGTVDSTRLHPTTTPQRLAA